ncbi:MAG: exodeoxyribonuclease VII large subunit [Acidimicrobiia bacterium]
MDEQPTFSVTELNTVIRDALRAAIPREVWVQGEVQGLKTSGLGHSYFQLVEKAGRGERVLSRLDIALFRGERPAVNAALRDAGLKLADDVGVRIRGRVDFYPPNGRLQLVMTGIDPVFTIGGMAANRERVLKALAADGLLRANAAVPLPAVPLRVGLVTSEGSAAYHDFVHALEVSGYAWQVCLADVRVQGSGAPKRIVWALRSLAHQRVDVVVIVRGGGSRSDLAPFDAEAVARAVAEMPVPVLTGIGHEVDRSVADEVAHTSCKTPTACAQELVERVGEFVDRLDGVSRAVASLARSRCRIAAHELGECARRVRRGAPVALVQELGALERRQGRVEELGKRGVHDAAGALEARRRLLVAAGGRLTRGASRQLDADEARVRALDPRRVLERGYSITRDERGSVRRDADGLSSADVLHTELARGSITSRVEAVSPPNEESERE